MVGVGICVDLSFFLVWFNCPYDVATNFDKYIRNSLDVNPGHDRKNPLSMACIHVDGTALNEPVSRYCISSGRNDV